jgi:response regulator RpfG family c-di-GMP phosphodiesterase
MRNRAKGSRMRTNHIICVDDESMVLQSLRREIKQDSFFSDFAVDVVESGPRALGLIEEIVADGDDVPVIVSDQRMPVMNGDAFLLEARRRSPETLCVLLTGFSDLTAVVNLVNQNALYRYLSKPWDRDDLLLTVKEAYRAWKRERVIQDQGEKIERLTMAMVGALESANFYFDEETGNHIKRISLLSEYIAHEAGFDEHFVKTVKLYSPLHDIGKVGVEKDILLKPGKLTPEEFELVKEHVKIGYRILDSAAIDPLAKNIVLYHHEKWSGKGYPQGLSGDEIPLEARIVSIADVYDALVNERVYKRAFSVSEALDIIRGESGASFDPELVRVFLSGMEGIGESRKYPFGQE